VKWGYAVAGLVILYLILRAGKQPALSAPAGKVSKTMCIDANVLSGTWGMEVPCDDQDPASHLDALAPLTAGGANNTAGASLNPTGYPSSMITYDKV
jgi:hypothetical protein